MRKEVSEGWRELKNEVLNDVYSASYSIRPSTQGG
jgi:hypothetical protein